MPKKEIPNPLAVLGFTPESLAGLTDREIEILVGERYKALARFLHPDVAGEAAAPRFRAVQAAYDELGIAATFQEARESFLRKGRRTSQERLAEQIEGEAAAYEDGLSSFLARAPVPLWLRDGDKPVFSVFEPPPCLVLLHDTMPFYTLQRAGRHEKARWRQELSLNRGIYQYQLEIRADGSMFTTPLEQVLFDDRKESPPADVPPEWVSYRGTHFNCFYFRRTAPPTPFQDKLIGSIVLQQYKWDLGPESLEWTKGFVPGEVDASDFERANEGYPIEFLVRYLPYYRPWLFLQGLVLAVNLRGPEPRIRVIGQSHRFHIPKAR